MTRSVGGLGFVHRFEPENRDLTLVPLRGTRGNEENLISTILYQPNSLEIDTHKIDL
jgi:hypothetical protein